MKKFGIIIMMVMILLSGCNSSNEPKTVDLEPTTETEFLLDTLVSITLYGDDSKYMSDLFDLIEVYDEKLDAHDEKSEVYRVNKRESNVLSDELKELLERSFVYSELSKGYYDVTIAPLVDLWDIQNQPTEVPSDEDIEIAKSKVDYKSIDISDHKISFASANTKIDLGGIAKGYIADKLVESIRSKGIERAVINLGGNVVVVGEKAPGVPFKVALQDPDELRGESLGVLSLSDESIVTSGIYERYVEIDGVRYHHMINPFTGYPENNDLKSVTIMSDSSTDGDALSTSVFLLGREKGLELAEKLEDVDAIIITKSNKIYTTSGIGDAFDLRNDNYELVK
ncbi:MAG: FAD:protein FMN transferase [Tissierellales bacterium]|nr:FAD:protein FMN transferase [Tissierellales bacterium]